ncbi:hypothetical protein [Paracoccus versutus]
MTADFTHPGRETAQDWAVEPTSTRFREEEIPCQDATETSA